MNIAVPKEYYPGENRVPMIPANVKKIAARGGKTMIEKGMGASAGFSDEEYRNAGAQVTENRRELLSRADMVLRVRKPPLEEIEILRPGCIHISYLDPFNEKKLLLKFISRSISAISMEMIPRITRAQKLDALSSQASLAGYVAVILAADRLNRIFPLLMTPAGTLSPARVFVIGAGVAGLQAIATAKRLGGRIEAFDTRPAVAEEVRSLGAKFIQIDIGETGQTKEGYAKALTEQQLEVQRLEMKKHCAVSDVVITTAQVFGSKAPRIITADMIDGMKKGSIIVDLAVESGGNVEGSEAGREVEFKGVKIIGLENLPGRVAFHASLMYSNNLTNLILEFWDDDAKRMVLPLDDEIIKGCVVSHEKRIINERLRSFIER
ncbi:MAG: Re/Si-specific NAD(P)(+) transhydrogenase subunit alpha [Syntrophales bacterium]|jgi:NAD(P) transhydrogenase subunit alpha|nr:Re/Si-specific NAD(P)(+) transhydrogenase subunit alpha [Syntrophales bacterium]MDY0043557.1 Re/Si-specific NAD(P)(+) transhydrogenase subunit alpha [Syntrophales bacterium]